MLVVVHLLRIKLYNTAEGEGGSSPGDISGDHTVGEHGQPQTWEQMSPRAALAEMCWQSCLWGNWCPHLVLEVCLRQLIYASHSH